MVRLRDALPRFYRDVEETTAEDVPGLLGFDPSSTFGAWALSLAGLGFSPRLIERVWAANRCLQLNAQQVGSYPLRFIGAREPAWLTNPDPVWFPNGIGSAVEAAVKSLYGNGSAFLLVTARYADGLPSGWTVVDPTQINVQVRNGRRSYEANGKPIPADDVVQIDRNPGNRLRGTSALQAFASHLWGALGSAEASRALQGESPIPPAILKSTKRPLTREQAVRVQDQWVAARAGGRPPVLPPELDFDTNAFSPKDLMLLEAQEFDARVIAAAFGVPAFMLNMPMEGGLTYTNPEILFDYWWRAELKPTAKRISDALTAQMLPRGSSVRFDARESLEPGLADLHKVWNDALTAGSVTIDEYRRAVLNLGPLGDEGAVEELLESNTAGASPADQSVDTTVVALRPTGVVT